MEIPAIKLVSVSAGFGSQRVLERIYFEVKKGEIIGISGPNGAGKTTLLNVINGLAKIYKGRVFINGLSFTIFNQSSLRRKIGYVPQVFEVDEKMPIYTREVIMMGSYGTTGIFHFPSKCERELLVSLAEALEISHLLYKPFGHLSGGEKKRVLIARALMQKPEILLLDEVFSWLDWKITEKIMDFIKEIHEKEKLTILIVSHNIEILRELCLKLIWMKEGKIEFLKTKG